MLAIMQPLQHCARSGLRGSSEDCMLPAGDRHISYLPLAHIYERVTLVGITHGGVSIGFYRYLHSVCNPTTKTYLRPSNAPSSASD